MVATPITAAGVPPRNTIATTRARKLPEIFSFDSVETAVRSLNIEKASSTTNSGRSQLQAGARQKAAARTSRRPAAMTTIARRVGRGWAIFGLESANRERALKESANPFPSASLFPARGARLAFPLFANPKVRPLAADSARDLAAWPNSPKNHHHRPGLQDRRRPMREGPENEQGRPGGALAKSDQAVRLVAC